MRNRNRRRDWEDTQRFRELVLARTSYLANIGFGASAPVLRLSCFPRDNAEET